MICDTNCTRVQSNHLLLSHSCIVFHALLQSLSCHPHPLCPIVSPSADSYTPAPSCHLAPPNPPQIKKEKQKNSRCPVSKRDKDLKFDEEIPAP